MTSKKVALGPDKRTPLRSPPGTFVQIHRSVAINVDRVAGVGGVWGDERVLAQTRSPQVGKHPVQVSGLPEGLALGKPVEREVFLDAADLLQR